MHWNHRLVRDRKGLGIFEVHYNESNEPVGLGNVKTLFCDKDWKEPDDIACLHEQIDMINEAFTRTILNYPEDFDNAMIEMDLSND